MSFVIDPDLLGLNDKVVLVVGGGGPGVGRAHCIQLARAGCHVVVASRSAERGAGVVREVMDLGRLALFVSTDATKADDLVAA